MNTEHEHDPIDEAATTLIWRRDGSTQSFPLVSAIMDADGNTISEVASTTAIESEAST